MSNYVYRFTVGMGNREISEDIDLIDRYGWTEEELDLMTEEEIREEVMMSDLRVWWRQHLHWNVERVNG